MDKPNVVKVGENVWWGEKDCISLCVMRQLVYEFLDAMYRNNPITKRCNSRDNIRYVETYVDSDNVLVIETRNYADGNYTESMDSILKMKIGNYLGIHGVLLKLYVLDWCKENYNREEVII